MINKIMIYDVEKGWLLRKSVVKFNAIILIWKRKYKRNIKICNAK